MQRLTRHGESKANKGKEFQRQLAPNLQRWVEGEKSRNGKRKASPGRGGTKSKGPEFAMANNILARRAKASKTLRADVAETHWWRNINSPLRAYTREASSSEQNYV